MERRAIPHDSAELDDLGVLRIRGVDAIRFLQGQLSNDIERLAREGSLLAGFHNPQGRTIAILRLLQAAEHDILAVLPHELVAGVAQRLGRFILRAKVQITDDSAAWRVRGLVHPEAPDGLAVGVPGETARWIAVLPRTVSDSPGAGSAVSAGAQPGAGPSSADAASVPDSTARRAWRLLDIAAGLPQVYAATSEQFVAQMLNLDVVDAVSFSKGCYTGQEVIARAHYRGRVKRRMQRWRTRLPALLAPGETARLADGRTLRVVEAAALPDGRCEFLAVAPLAAGADGEPAEGGTSAAASGAPPAGDVLDAEPLPLPYAPIE